MGFFPCMHVELQREHRLLEGRRYGHVLVARAYDEPTSEWITQEFDGQDYEAAVLWLVRQIKHEEM